MLTPLRVLIVEDCEDDAQLLIRALRHGEWEVMHERVDTPEAMRAALEAKPWDLIVADYSMPQFSGPAALAMARDLLDGVPFILVSGKIGEETAVNAMKAGADDYLIKGELGRLVPAVRRELRDADARRRSRHIERQLRKRDAQLADAQRLAHLGTWHLEVKTNLAVWSDEASSILGSRPDHAALTFDQFLACLHPDDLPLITGTFHAKNQASFAQDFRLICPQTRAKFVHIRGEIVRDENGTPIEAMGMIQDITERKVAEEELQKAQSILVAAKGLAEANEILLKEVAQRQVAEKALMELNETLENRVADRTRAAEDASNAKSEFLANMSHEIRTPLTAILGFADLLLRQDQSPAEQAECIHTVRRNAKHLLELINDILDLSKIEAGKMTVETMECDLPRFLADVLTTMKPRAAEKALDFHVTFAERIPRLIRTDPLRFRQVLVNLLGNAIKFTKTGAIGLNIRFENRSGRNLLFVEVTDTGIGLNSEPMARLFQTFTQADESTTRRFGGTGLGLSISRRLARLLGGDVEVQSRPNIGSQFTISIDCGETAGVETLVGFSESQLPTAVVPLAVSEVCLCGTILLAEDGRDNQRLLTTHLRAAGAQVAVAVNGRIAVDMAIVQSFDLILMDMQMPEMDGYAATAELRRRGFKGPIVALTANAMAEDRTKCLACGCNDYLTKPIDQETLLRAVSMYLSQSAPPLKWPAPPEPSPLPPNQGVGTITSSMSHYPGMKQITIEFVEGLSATVAKIEELLLQDDLLALKRVAHQLRGTGGGYGFNLITELAGNVEEAIKASNVRESINEQIGSLIDVIRRVEGFHEGLALAAPAIQSNV